jgi:hypothetical protein
LEQRRDHGLDANPRFTGAGQLVANEHARDGSRELDVEMSAKRIDQAAWELACRIDRDLQSIHLIIDPRVHFLCPPHSDREHAVGGSDNFDYLDGSSNESQLGSEPCFIRYNRNIFAFKEDSCYFDAEQMSECLQF